MKLPLTPLCILAMMSAFDLGTDAAPTIPPVVTPSNALLPQNSLLWGQGGEKWTPQSRLPDFSHAGYHGGQEPPVVQVVKNVKTDFGAKGDGKTDDSLAFERAIAGTDNGALLIPAGRYKLTRVLEIHKGNLVLRGEGPEKTVLEFSESLRTAGPRQKPDGDWNFNRALAQPELPSANQAPPFKPDDDWRFRGGYIWVEGTDEGIHLTDLTAPARRGDTQLKLANTAGIVPGQFVRLLQFDDAQHTLGRHLHADQVDPGPQTYERVTNKFIDWVAQVTAVDGNTLTLDRPLRTDIRLAWKPQLWSYQPTVQEVGLENLGFVFPGKTYPGHLKEEGFNATYFKQVANCWMRNIWVTDADIAFNFEWMVRFSTIENVRTLAKVRREDIGRWSGSGHHAIQMAYFVQDCLATRFRFDTHYVHDITVDTLVSGNVFSQGSGLSVNFDHHRGASYENLFSDIDLGRPDYMWASSGKPENGPPTGVRETFWNIRATGNLPKQPNWVQMNLIGTGQTAQQTTDKLWSEPLSPALIFPRDLHEAQRARRLQGVSSTRTDQRQP
ncbi:hypothetical protein EON83_13620 [bacterium]|nr:MAG: hypothetical protein EON83_13620 [bacterium]